MPDVRGSHVILLTLLLAGSGCFGASQGSLAIADPQPIMGGERLFVPSDDAYELGVDGPGWGRLALRAAGDAPVPTRVSIQTLTPIEPAEPQYVFVFILRTGPDQLALRHTQWTHDEPPASASHSVLVTPNHDQHLLVYTNAQELRIRLQPHGHDGPPKNLSWALVDHERAKMHRPQPIRTSLLNDPLARIEQDWRYDQPLDAVNTIILGHMWATRTPPGYGTLTAYQGRRVPDGGCQQQHQNLFQVHGSDVRIVEEWVEPRFPVGRYVACVGFEETSVGASRGEQGVAFAVVPTR